MSRPSILLQRTASVKNMFGETQEGIKDSMHVVRQPPTYYSSEDDDDSSCFSFDDDTTVGDDTDELSEQESFGSTIPTTTLCKPGEKLAPCPESPCKSPMKSPIKSPTKSPVNMATTTPVITTPSLSPRKKYRHWKKRVTFNIPKKKLGEQHDVFTYVHQEHDKDEVWWTKEELIETRSKCVVLVRHIKSCEQDYERSLDILSRSFDSNIHEESIAAGLQELADLSAARGLERHIVPSIAACCRKHERTVLEAQDRLDGLCILDTEHGLNLLSNTAVESSKEARQLALKLAEYDVHEAYRSVLGPWIGGTE